MAGRLHRDVRREQRVARAAPLRTSLAAARRPVLSPRAVAVRNALGLWVLAIAACSEAGTPQSTETPAVASTAASDAAAKTEAAKVVRVRGDTIELDGRAIAKLRPADAPGELGPDLVPRYEYGELRDAFTLRHAQRLLVDDAAPVAILRGALSSVPADTAIELGRMADSAAGIPVRAGAPAGALRIRLRRGAVELKDGATTVKSVDSPARAAELLAGVDRARLAAGVVLDGPDDRKASELVAIATAIAPALGDAPLMLAIEHAPCVVPPEGMSCVPGGPAIVGSDDGPPEERPRRELELSTFYMDRKEITIAEYDACHAAKGCAMRINGYQKIMQPFVGPEQPMVPLDWNRAMRYCAWKGKRLPSEWEWEKAARGPDGDIYPWGDDEPTCERAQYRECAPVGCTPYPGKEHRWDCNEHDTKKVGSFPPGHYGLFEMAGNGYEWTQTAGVEDLRDCGAECNGKDPLGPCDGAYPCKVGRRVLRGGSWYWPVGRIKGSHRRIETPRSGSHRLSGRCATTDPWLTAFPPASIADPPAAIPDPEPPSAEDLQRFGAITQDPIEDKPICSDEVRKLWGTLQERGGRSETTCRDPFPYLEPNEPRAYLWARYLANVGGAYLGVASDQNYSFIAVARSQWAWVMDYDPRVTDHHQRVRAFVLGAETPADFVALWSQAGSKRAIELLESTYADSPALAKLRRGYWATRDRLHLYFGTQLERNPKAPDYGWLANPEHYAYIRTLFQQGRIMPIKGDLLGTGSMQSVAAAAKALGVPIRVYYTSNAPSSWGGQLTDAYKANVLALPMDARSIVLQTLSKGAFRQTGHWHHSVASGKLVQSRMRLPGYDFVMTVLFDRIPTDHGDVTALGLPGVRG